MENGLILMGDLPRKYGLIVMGDLPRKRKSGLILWVTYPGEGMASFLWVTYPDKQKMENGLILMGDLPRKVWSHCDG